MGQESRFWYDYVNRVECNKAGSPRDRKLFNGVCSAISSMTMHSQWHRRKELFQVGWWHRKHWNCKCAYLTWTCSIILSYGKFLSHDYPSSMNVPESGSPMVRLFVRQYHFCQYHRQKRIIPSWLITPQIEFQHWKQFLISELKWKYGSQFGYIKCNSLKFHFMQILKTIFSVENICSVEILFAV